MQTRLITTEPELLALKDSWNELVRKRPETNVPFYSWDWFYRSWKHFAQPYKDELAVVTVLDGERLLGILPTVRGMRKSSGISWRTLGFCNTSITPRNRAYVAYDEDEIRIYRAIADGVFSHCADWDMLELANVPETSSFHRFCEEGFAPAKARIRNRGFTSLSTHLDGTVEDYIASLSRNTRRYFRKHLRKFEETEGREVRFFEMPEQMTEGLDFLRDVHRQSWKGEYRDNHVPEFYREISETLSVRDEVVIGVLLLSGVPIAGGYIVRNEDTYFYSICDFDLRYGEHSPGMMLFIYELEQMLGAGRRTFDFCGTAYDYKEKLTQIQERHSTFQIFHDGWKSRFVFSAKTFWLPLFRKILRKTEPDDLISVKKR